MHVLAFGTGEAECTDCPHRFNIQHGAGRTVSITTAAQSRYAVCVESFGSPPETSSSTWRSQADVETALRHNFLISVDHQRCARDSFGAHGTRETVGKVFKCGGEFINVSIEPVYE